MNAATRETAMEWLALTAAKAFSAFPPVFEHLRVATGKDKIDVDDGNNRGNYQSATHTECYCVSPEVEK